MPKKSSSAGRARPGDRRGLTRELPLEVRPPGSGDTEGIGLIKDFGDIEGRVQADRPWLVSGHRRVRAMRRGGITYIPVHARRQAGRRRKATRKPERKS